MEVVLDTNVLVAGMLNPAGKPGELVDLTVSGQITLAYDDRIISEYHTVLRRARFGLEETDVSAVLVAIEKLGRRVVTQRVSKTLPDDADRCFIECAYVCPSLTLITGNKKHFPHDVCGGIKVISPGEFFEEFFP